MTNITSEALHALRRDLYPPHRYVWAEEVTVPDSDPKRLMDAACIDTHFKDARTIGFEVKVSRGDWLNDKDGKKSEQAREALDMFTFVFGSPDIYKVEEVPERAGIIHIVDGHAVEVRTPRYAMPKDNGYWVRRGVRAILKRSLTTDDTGFVNRIKREAEEKGRKKALSEKQRRSPIAKQGHVKHSARLAGKVPEPEEDENGFFCE